jgi:nitrogen regulatory protein PII
MGRDNMTSSESMVVVIVNRGKGSKILKFVNEMGITDVGCLYGKGTMQNKLRRMMEMDEVRKELIFIVIPSERETEILNRINKEFYLERKNHGIAFTIPIKDNLKGEPLDYSAIFLITDKDKAEQVIEISQEAGYFGGTIIETGKDTGKLNQVLDMVVEPDKEVVLMVLVSNSADSLMELLSDKLHLSQDREALIKVGVSKAVGLYEDSVFGGLE